MPDREFLPTPLVLVAITGTLSVPRESAARLINASQNAQFVASVTYHTGYLVSALADSQKAKKARKIGVEILTEKQLFEYLANGFFPPAKTHEYQRSAPPEFIVDWKTRYPEPKRLSVKYKDSHEQYSERELDVFAVGSSPSGITYLSVLDAEGFKTFRMDRIIEMTEISHA